MIERDPRVARRNTTSSLVGAVLMLAVAAVGLPLLVGTAAAAATDHAAADGATFTYVIGTRGAVDADVGEFARVVDETLNDPRGWSLDGRLRFVHLSGDAAHADFEVVLASPAAVARANPVCSAVYSCRVGDDVLINDQRWQLGAAPYPLPLDQYRHYVVNHEVGHWLGLGHRSCPGDGAPAPVMMQESKGIGECHVTVWPTSSERRAVAEAHAPDETPFGSLDEVRTDGAGVRVRGWAIDPDTTDPIDVHVYVDGHGYAVHADQQRPDVAVAFARFGGSHGFDIRLPLAPGTHHVCAYAIDVGFGDNPLLGCDTVDVAAPFGTLDVAAPSQGHLRVAGWAIDPGTTDPIDVHVYVDGHGYAVHADQQRPDVGEAFPSYGAAHGYDVSLPLPAGRTTRVCAYGIAVGEGPNALLACADVAVGGG
jgi:hypothetical protein